MAGQELSSASYIKSIKESLSRIRELTYLG